VRPGGPPVGAQEAGLAPALGAIVTVASSDTTRVTMAVAVLVGQTERSDVASVDGGAEWR
jgi:hypothetical protein